MSDLELSASTGDLYVRVPLISTWCLIESSRLTSVPSWLLFCCEGINKKNMIANRELGDAAFSSRYMLLGRLALAFALVKHQAVINQFKSQSVYD